MAGCYNDGMCIRGRLPCKHKLQCIDWKEEYTIRLRPKPRFYRFVGKCKRGISYFIIIRWDRTPCRIIKDKFIHDGQPNAMYFDDVKKMKNYAFQNYRIILPEP